MGLAVTKKCNARSARIFSERKRVPDEDVMRRSQLNRLCVSDRLKSRRIIDDSNI